jgi:anaerobic ribonucleoside-triphosphate reductase activating protein
MEAVPELVNVAHVADSVWSAGPGRLLTVWVQGCHRDCPGCINADFLDFRINRLVEPKALAELLRPEHDGICFSGGEPFLQASALALLARLVRAADRTVVSYSGFTLAELRSGVVPGAAELLAELDVLIDGPFEPARSAPLPWRGSRNQQVHFLTPRHRPEILQQAVSNDLALGSEGARTVGTGGPAIRKLFAALKKSGWNLQSPVTSGQTDATAE